MTTGRINQIFTKYQTLSCSGNGVVVVVAAAAAVVVVMRREEEEEQEAE